MIELKPVSPYSTDYKTCLDESKQERNTGLRRDLNTRVADMTRYDTVFLGYPNWWSTIPAPVATFLRSYDLTGKTIVPFCSHGGGGVGHSAADIANYAPGATLKEPLGVYYGGGASIREDIRTWLEHAGLLTKALIADAPV